MRFATGVEISVTWAGLTVHVVGLRFDPSNVALAEGLRKTRAGRAERAKRIGERLAGMGMPGAYEGALPFAGNPELISRTHFARYLVEAGYCPDVQTVFNKYLGDDCAGHVPMQWATLAEAVGWIRGAGGRAVIAHPGRYKYTPLQFAALFDEFIELGGEGIEVNTGSHTADEALQVRRRGASLRLPGLARLGLPQPHGKPDGSRAPARAAAGPEASLARLVLADAPRPLRHAIDPDRAHAAPPP